MVSFRRTEVFQGRIYQLKISNWGLLPLDRRPISYKPLKRLAKLLNLKFKLFNPKSLEEASKALRGFKLILSLDRYLFGGLIPSRDPDVVLAKPLEARLRDLLSLLRRLTKGNNRVILFSSIPRILPTGYLHEGLQRAILDFHSTCYELSEGKLNWNLYERVADEDFNYRDLINQLLKVRRYKHELHNRLIEELYTLPGVDLVICLDDNQENSIAQLEYHYFLRKAKRTKGLQTIIGIDQAPYQIFLRALFEDLSYSDKFIAKLEETLSEDELGRLRSFKLKLPFKVSLRYPHNLAGKPIYEPITLEELIEQNYKFLRLSKTSYYDIPVARLYLNNFKSAQEEASTQLRDWGVSEFQEVLSLIPTLEEPQFMKGVTRIADIQYANGGSLELLPHLSDNFRAVEVYWAWNTTANTLGTSFVHSALLQIARDLNLNYKPENALLVAERILEEAIYQPIVRILINDALRDRGIDPYKLPESLLPELSDICKEMCNSLLKALDLPFQVSSVGFPLRRTFEIDFNINLSRGLS